MPSPKEIRNTHINIGTGIDISIKELALTIKKIVEFKGSPKTGGYIAKIQ